MRNGLHLRRPPGTPARDFIIDGFESVDDGVSGVLVANDGVEAFAQGLERARRMHVDPEAVRARALRFSRARFDAGVRGAVEALMAEPVRVEVA